MLKKIPVNSWAIDMVFEREYKINLDERGRVYLGRAFGELPVLMINKGSFFGYPERRLVCFTPGYLRKNRVEVNGVPYEGTSCHQDSEGRIKLTEEMIRYLGLTPPAEVIVAGALQRIDIWNPEDKRRFDDYARGEDHRGIRVMTLAAEFGIE